MHTLDLLQLTYLTRSLFYLSQSMKEEILHVLHTLLSDPHIEVRDMAAATLSGIVRCSQRPPINHLTQSYPVKTAPPLPLPGTPGS